MSGNSGYPRVLVVGHAPDSVTGGGITLSNLLKGWPKERLAVAALIQHSPNIEVCDQYYKMGSREYRLVWPLRQIWPYSMASGPVELPIRREILQKEGIVLDPAQQLGTTSRLDRNGVRQLVHSFVAFSGAEQIVRRIHVSPELISWIDDFEPEIIYTQAASLHVIRLVSELCSLTKLPLVIHMMDDWPSTLYARKVLGPYLRWRIKVEFPPLVRQASALMGISPKMCQAFEARYGRVFVPFQNALETAAWLRTARKDWRLSVPFRLIYTGTIAWSNDTSLRDVADTVAELHASGYHVRFDLFTLDHSTELGRSYEQPGCVFVNPPLPHKDIPTILARADVLILPLNFDSYSIQFARYSMPTKTPEYMVSGSPVLVYAPPGLALTEYAQEFQWGHVVVNQGKEPLKRALLQLMSDQSLREQLGRRAQELAIDLHDAMRVRDGFRLALSEVTSKPLA